MKSIQEQPKTLWATEACYKDEEKYEQETISFDKTADSFKKIVIVEKSMKPRRDEKGYVTMGVKEFLLDRESLEA